MDKQPKKKRFEVREGESIGDCLDRMNNEGYQVTRRMEKPIFKEEETSGQRDVRPVKQQIVFEAIKKNTND